MSDWEPTNELRWVERKGAQYSADIFSTERVLQQRWRKCTYRAVMSCERSEYDHEWRDVPNVTDGG